VSSRRALQILRGFLGREPPSSFDWTRTHTCNVPESRERRGRLPFAYNSDFAVVRIPDEARDVFSETTGLEIAGQSSGGLRRRGPT
jgi:hypothetical protein